jgi:hypothetical protein
MSTARDQAVEVTALPWFGGLIGWVIGWAVVGRGPSDAGFAGVVAGFDAALVLVLALRPSVVARDRTMRMLTICFKLALVALIAASTVSALEGALQSAPASQRDVTRAISVAPFGAALGFVVGHLIEEMTDLGKPRVYLLLPPRPRGCPRGPSHGRGVLRLAIRIGT